MVQFGRGAYNQAVAPGITRPLYVPDSKHINLGKSRIVFKDAVRYST